MYKQLKLPKVANYTDILQQSKPESDLTNLLLDLLISEMKA